MQHRVVFDGEVDDARGAVDICTLLGLGVGGHVVDRGEVDDVVDLGQFGAGQGQPGRGEIPGDRMQAIRRSVGEHLVESCA